MGISTLDKLLKSLSPCSKIGLRLLSSIEFSYIPISSELQALSDMEISNKRMITWDPVSINSIISNSAVQSVLITKECVIHKV